MARPARASAIPSRMTMPWTRRAVAPSATRTPISRVRATTDAAITPYTPTAASASARAAKTPIRSMLKRGRLSWAFTRSCMVRSCAGLISGSTARSRASATFAIAVASPLVRSTK